jgi:hydroxyethylthiazole kinase-like uncharacterized protein yjeF
MSNTGLPSLPDRPADAHKGSVGRVLVIAGSRGMVGAGVLVCRAAYRAGAGLVTWAFPESLATLIGTSVVETITLPYPDGGSGMPSLNAREHLSEASFEADAVVLGSGLAVSGEAGELVRLLIPEIHAPLVLDAGALTALGTEFKPLEKRERPTILTPHPGEMSRLTGVPVKEIQADRSAAAQALASNTGALVVLKGAGTVIASPEALAVNESGNPGMATAGAGDVLAGVIAALLGQGMAPFDAARLGAYLHGLAGDIAAEERGVHGVMAGDLIEALPAAYRRFGS